MAKVYPQLISTSASSSSSSSTSSSNRETYTIWMKSLVLNGNGCTAFDSNGKIVYRIDNYDTKRSREVYLMDLQGKVICTLLRKRFMFFGHWNGYRCNGLKTKKEKPWFQVRQNFNIGKGDSTCRVTMRSEEAQASCYRFEGSVRKSAFKIIDGSTNRLIAEVNQKKSSSGIAFGNDVLSLVVEPHSDHTLIMALVSCDSVWIDAS